MSLFLVRVVFTVTSAAHGDASRWNSSASGSTWANPIRVHVFACLGMACVCVCGATDEPREVQHSKSRSSHITDVLIRGSDPIKDSAVDGVNYLPDKVAQVEVLDSQFLDFLQKRTHPLTEAFNFDNPHLLDVNDPSHTACGICFQTYDCRKRVTTPCLLACGHTYCTACLEPSLQEDTGMLACPICNNPTVGLAKNSALCELMQAREIEAARAATARTELEPADRIDPAYACDEPVAPAYINLTVSVEQEAKSPAVTRLDQNGRRWRSIATTPGTPSTRKQLAQ